MGRKPAGSIEEVRNEIKRKYKRGNVTRPLTSEESLSQFERDMRKSVACYLKAADFTYGYIADSLGLGTSTVRRWFAEDPEMQAEATRIRNDMVGGAVTMLKTYAVEIIETLYTMFKTTDDEKLAKEIGFELLDRMGITKVNKSESAASVVNRNEVDITDKTGLLEATKNAPPQVQAQMASQMEALLALAHEHAEDPAEETTSA